MRYLLSMLLAFGSGMFMVVTSAHLACDGSVTAWVGVGILGILIFLLFICMALVSVQAERAAEKGEPL